MTTALLFLLLAAEPAEAAATTANGPEPLARLLVIDLKVEQGVSESAARLLNEMLLAKLQATGKYQVFGQADLRSMLDVEQQKQLVGCSEVACMAEIGGALGAERVLFGSVGTLGKSYVLNLHLLNNAEARVEARWSETFEGDEDELVGAVDRAIATLVPVDSATTAMQEEDDDRFYQTWWFWTLVGVGALGATAGILTATSNKDNDVAPMVDANVEVVLP